MDYILQSVGTHAAKQISSKVDGVRESADRNLNIKEAGAGGEMGSPLETTDPPQGRADVNARSPEVFLF